VRDGIDGAPHPPGRGPGPEAPPGAHPRRRATLRHLRALEAPGRAAHRLEPRPQRRRPPEHPPFMSAEVLRHNKKPKLNITWDKDRGQGCGKRAVVQGFWGERINDHHLRRWLRRKAARGGRPWLTTKGCAGSSATSRFKRPKTLRTGAMLTLDCQSRADLW
jgi:hypothetical protein